MLLQAQSVLSLLVAMQAYKVTAMTVLSSGGSPAAVLDS